MKHLEGKTIYLRPTGNNARRGDKNRVETGFVEKVARVFVTVRLNNHSFSNKYRVQGDHGNGKRLHLDGGYNSGYYVYESLEELERQKEVDDMARKISGKYRYAGDWEKVDYHVMKEICELLDI